MADSEAKARQALEEAEKKSKKGGFLCGLFGGGSSVNEACELYNQAGNYFKAAKNWTAAGDVFLTSAELHATQADSKHAVALDYDKAATAFRKVDPQKAVKCLKRASEIYVDMGRFIAAAKINSTIAEIYETELPDKARSIKHHQVAADFYKAIKHSDIECLIRVARLSAKSGDYQRAIEVFEEIATYEADHALLKYFAKDHFSPLYCAICSALKRYEDISPSFAGSLEYKFIKDLTICIEEHNVDAFTEAVRSYANFRCLESWQATLLLNAKKQCGAGSDDQ